MELPRFSELLLKRRQELGISLTQASQILKLKEQVLSAFELGDFTNMPQSGYAQGMLSSYARYLGLNPREVVDLFSEELYQYQHGTTSHELRRRTRANQSGRGLAGYDVINEEGSRPKAYVEYRPLLPTSGGRPGDMGAFATVSNARSRSGGYSYAAYKTGRAYNSDASAENTALVQAPRRRTSTGPGRSQTDPAVRLLSQEQQVSPETRRSVTSQLGASGRVGGASRPRPSRQSGRDRVSMRSVGHQEYTDDLILDSTQVSSFEQANTVTGRRSSRNIATPERPRVQRRSSAPSGAGRGGYSRRPERRPSGPTGIIQRIMSDPRASLLGMGLLLVLVLVLILVFSVRSCVSARTSNNQNKTVAVSTSTETSQDTQEQSSDSSNTNESSSNASHTTAEVSETTAVQQPTQVVVTLAKGKVSWVEITVDGVSEVADTLTGAWTQTYAVTDSMTIQVGNPDALTVTKDGEEQTFTETKTGIGTLTIKGNGIKADGTQATSTDETTNTTGTTGTSTGTTGTTGSTTSSGSTASGSTSSRNTSSSTRSTSSTSTNRSTTSTSSSGSSSNTARANSSQSSTQAATNSSSSGTSTRSTSSSSR